MEIKEGIGCTVYYYSDSCAYTVIKVIDDKTAIIQRDKAIRTDNNGMSTSQVYRYEINTDGIIWKITKRKDGKWHLGTTLKGEEVILNRRDEYFDYSF